MKHEDDGCGQQVRSNDLLGVTPAAWLIDENGPHTRSVYCVFDEGERSRCLEDGATVTATPLYAIPKGWRLVPAEPTPEMHRAVCELQGYTGFAEHWRAALAAAPTTDA